MLPCRLMNEEERAVREAHLRARVQAGDVDGAAAGAIQLYGAELFGFLLALHRHEEDAASEVFAAVCEQVWRGLAAFEWRSSLRTWMYATARHASSSHFRAEKRRARRTVPLDACPAVAEVEARVRTETLSYLRTERKEAIRRLREELPAEDQALLVLRVDRDLSFQDLARVFLGEDASPEALGRESARLRKRFQLLKRRLLDMGRQRGLLPAPGDGRAPAREG